MLVGTFRCRAGRLQLPPRAGRARRVGADLGFWWCHGAASAGSPLRSFRRGSEDRSHSLPTTPLLESVAAWSSPRPPLSTRVSRCRWPPGTAHRWPTGCPRRSSLEAIADAVSEPALEDTGWSPIPVLSGHSIRTFCGRRSHLCAQRRSCPMTVRPGGPTSRHSRCAIGTPSPDAGVGVRRFGRWPRQVHSQAAEIRGAGRGDRGAVAGFVQQRRRA